MSKNSIIKKINTIKDQIYTINKIRNVLKMHIPKSKLKKFQEMNPKDK